MAYQEINFEFEGLEYHFSFSPETDYFDEGPTLTAVLHPEHGRLSPSTWADPKAWDIAKEKFGWQPGQNPHATGKKRAAQSS